MLTSKQTEVTVLMSKQRNAIAFVSTQGEVTMLVSKQREVTMLTTKQGNVTVLTVLSPKTRFLPTESEQRHCDSTLSVTHSMYVCLYLLRCNG